MSDGQGVRVLETGLAVIDRDRVAGEIQAHQVAQVLGDFDFAMHELRNREVLPQGVVDPVQAALTEAGEVERGLAKRLARDGAGVDQRAAEEAVLLDQGHALSEVGGLGRALLARRARPDDDEVELLGCSAHPLIL